MAETTAISWCDHTFNPWIGCTKVSPACDGCYAQFMMEHRYHRVKWGPGEDRKRTSKANWREPIRWNKAAASKEGRTLVFCASLADVFDNEVDPAWRRDLFDLIEVTPNLTWLLLTKRIGNVMKMTDAASDGHPLPFNAAVGATMANQLEYDRDRMKLWEVKQRRAPAFTFGSFEPLLGPIILDKHAPDWVIVGGETDQGQHKARPCHPDWLRSMRDQCASLGRPFHLKQWGEWSTGFTEIGTGKPVFKQFATFDQWVAKASTWVNGGICLDRHGAEMKNGADMLRARDEGRFPITIMHRVGKKRSGATLDGREHREMPR